MDMKCHTSSCWYCKDLCEICLLPSGFGPGLITKSKAGTSLKFCSQQCAHYFASCEEKSLSLDIEILSPGRKHISESETSETILRITGSGMIDERAIIICLMICHGYHSKKHPNGRFFIICQLRSLSSQKFIEMFVSDKAVLEEPLPHADCPDGREMVFKLEAYGTITQIITSAMYRIYEFLSLKGKEEFKLASLLKCRSHENIKVSIRLQCMCYMSSVHDYLHCIHYGI